MSPFLAIFFSIICGVASQLMLKHGMNELRLRPLDGSFILRIASEPWVIFGLLVYACGTLFWIIALSRLELSFVYPFGSLTYIGIVAGSYLLFKERITRTRLLGIVIIIAGLLIISQS